MFTKLIASHKKLNENKLKTYITDDISGFFFSSCQAEKEISRMSSSVWKMYLLFHVFRWIQVKKGTDPIKEI